MLEQLKSKLNSIPKWGWYLCIALAVFLISYALWLRFRKPDIKPGATVQALPAHQLKDMPQVAVPVKQVIVYRDKKKAIERLGLLEEPDNPQEELQTAVEIPKLKYGGTAATFVNVSSGQSRTLIKANESPWLAFRADNALGAGYGVGTHGQTVTVRYRHDVVQIKSVVISGELEGNFAALRPTPVEGRAMLFGEYRW